MCVLLSRCSIRSLPSFFAWPTRVGRERESEEFQLQGPSIIQGFRRLGYRTLGTGAVGWFDPATETGRCLTDEFERFFYPGSTWQLAEQLAWIENQRMDVCSEQPLLIFLNVGETHVPYCMPVHPGTVMTIPVCPFSGPPVSGGAPADAGSVHVLV